MSLMVWVIGNYVFERRAGEMALKSSIYLDESITVFIIICVRFVMRYYVWLKIIKIKICIIKTALKKFHAIFVKYKVNLIIKNEQ